MRGFPAVVAAALAAVLPVPLVMAQSPAGGPQPEPEAGAEAEAPVFSELSYEDAAARAEAEGKLLIVRGVARWVPAVRQMDEKVFGDAAVRRMMARHAVAIEVDIDDQAALAERLDLLFLPALVAYEGGEEIDRLTGYRGPDAVMSWLSRLVEGAGEPGADEVVPDEAGAADGVPPMSRAEMLGVRIDNVKALFAEGAYEASYSAALALWREMPSWGPAFATTRNTTVAADLGRLAFKDEASLEKLRALRDEAGRSLAEDPNFRSLEDWVVLSLRVLRDEAPVAEWLREAQGDPALLPALRRLRPAIKDFLIDEGFYELYGRMLTQPVRESARYAEIVRQTPPDAREYNITLATARREAVRMHAALLAAGRAREGWDVARNIIAAADSPGLRRAMFVQARRAGVLTEWHRDLNAGASADLLQDAPTPGERDESLVEPSGPPAPPPGPGLD